MIDILPLALTMMIGPQIIAAIILITSKHVIKNSISYLLGIAFAASLGTLVFTGLASVFDWSQPGSKEPSTTALVIQTSLIVILAAGAVRMYLNRATSTLPKWMDGLQTATPKKAFTTALALIFFMPTDLLAMATVGINLASHQDNGVRLMPFILLTLFIASLPLLTYLVFKKRAASKMPAIRQWMNLNSWVVSIAANMIFILLIWS